MISILRQLFAVFLSAVLAIPLAEAKGGGSNPKSSDSAVTDTYDYDAFGNLIHQTGTTPNNYLFAGEQFDPDLNLYYNRARYLNSSTGRFSTMDTDEGKARDPRSLHKYLYARANPISRRDPTGHDDIGEELEGASQEQAVGARTAAEATQTGANAAESVSEVQSVAEAEQLQAEAAQQVEQETAEEAQQLGKNATKRVGKLSKLLGRSQEEIRDAIHQMKRSLPRSGPIRNPDLVIDPETGDAYPELPGGGVGDPIGNIFDYLPDILED